MEQIIEQLRAWAERHEEDSDEYRLNAFLTVGDLRKIVAALSEK